jgi:hypothetical protein
MNKPQTDSKATQPEGQATVHGEVTYREGDGMPMPIPEGQVEVHPSRDSVTLGWREDNGAAGSTAMPRDDFERHVDSGAIRMDR